MLEAIVQGVKSIIDLRKKAREDKKTGLEIRKLDHELEEKERLVRPATFDEVEKFDPKVQQINAQFQPPPFQPPLAPSPPPVRTLPILGYACLGALGCFVVYWLVKLFIHLLK